MNARGRSTRGRDQEEKKGTGEDSSKNTRVAASGTGIAKRQRLRGESTGGRGEEGKIMEGVPGVKTNKEILRDGTSERKKQQHRKKQGTTKKQRGGGRGSKGSGRKAIDPRIFQAARPTDRRRRSLRGHRRARTWTVSSPEEGRRIAPRREQRTGRNGADVGATRPTRGARTYARTRGTPLPLLYNPRCLRAYRVPCHHQHHRQHLQQGEEGEEPRPSDGLRRTHRTSDRSS